MLICSVAALLAASGTQSANAIQGGNQDADAQYNLACAAWVSTRAAPPVVGLEMTALTAFWRNKTPHFL